MIKINPGTKLSSTVSTAEFIVIRGTGDVDLTCGGAALATVTPAGTTPPTGEPLTGATETGKRYTDESGDIELLCVKAGAGIPGLNGTDLTVKAARALPSSD